MTPSAVPLSNKIVMNKYICMSRQLRNINDVGSIINWANAMLLVKGLLFDPVPISSAADTLQPTSPRASPHQTTQNVFNTCNSQRPHPELSLTRPTAIRIQPSKNTVLRTSTSRCSSDIVPKPSHLTINSHCQPTIPTRKLLHRRGGRFTSHLPLTTTPLLILSITVVPLNMLWLSQQLVRQPRKRRFLMPHLCPRVAQTAGKEERNVFVEGTRKWHPHSGKSVLV